jgi:tetrahydromethanopterin S-methyltransferase subunit G
VVLFSASAFAAEETVTLPIADYKAILQQLDALQKRVEFLETSQLAAVQLLFPRSSCQ